MLLVIIAFTVCYIWLLGFLGNLSSAIVRLRRQFTTKNSSAVYLVALAINDMAYMLIPVAYLIPPCSTFCPPIYSLLSEAAYLLESSACARFLS